MTTRILEGDAIDADVRGRAVRQLVSEHWQHLLERLLAAEGNEGHVLAMPGALWQRIGDGVKTPTPPSIAAAACWAIPCLPEIIAAMVFDAIGVSVAAALRAARERAMPPRAVILVLVCEVDGRWRATVNVMELGRVAMTKGGAA